jgi:hypothetical protein
MGVLQDPAISCKMEGLPWERQYLGKRQSNPCTWAHQTLSPHGPSGEHKSIPDLAQSTALSSTPFLNLLLSILSISNHYLLQYSHSGVVYCKRRYKQVGMQSCPSRSPSPMSMGSTGSYYVARALCDANGAHINLADLYRQQQQLTICSAPLHTQPITRMFSNTSFNASNELPNKNPIQLPPCFALTLAPLTLSPCTIQTTLRTQPDLDTTLLWSIANGLLQTIANCEADTTIAKKHHDNCIHHLEQCILHYEDTFNHPPERFVLNNGQVTNFHIPIGNGLY